jgi:Holliday junction resolvasome RuvABC DNA-binding subunit
MTSLMIATDMPDALNDTIAGKLREMADLLEQQQADGFRITAYRRAAATVESLAPPIGDVARADGFDGLMALPGIGRGIAMAIMEMLSTGRWSQLERLRGALQPEQLFQTLPGIGPELAARMHGELHVDTLEALELAAHDGRLARVPGLGHRRVAGIRAALAERLGRQRIRALLQAKAPPVALLLDVDREYRAKAEAGSLRLIAPKRFNPTGAAWLPVLHTARGQWRFTALFSNTRKAHELAKTKDWVVVYAHLDAEPESQSTVVTERRGPLSGRRVVRGREEECAPYYAAMEAGSSASMPSAKVASASKASCSNLPLRAPSSSRRSPSG